MVDFLSPEWWDHLGAKIEYWTLGFGIAVLMLGVCLRWLQPWIAPNLDEAYAIFKELKEHDMPQIAGACVILLNATFRIGLLFWVATSLAIDL